MSKNNVLDWSFQEDAVRNIVKDFSSNPTGRFLLVVPTGGGKTVIALKAIKSLYNNKFFNKGSVLWVVHTMALKKQARDFLCKSNQYQGINLSKKQKNILKDLVDIKMKKAASLLITEKSKYKLLIVDEAHHSSAKGYRSFFENNIPVLGLTATPSRTDMKEMPFDKISYSISFRELEKKNIILIPVFIKKNTSETIKINSLAFNDLELDKFDTQRRNNFIAENIVFFKKKYNLKKIIVFVGNNKHVMSLYETCVQINRLKGEPFKHVGYIFGGNHNEKNIDNQDYLKAHKNEEDSLLINCRILNEGYDDPGIDAIVMATPTNSMLYYTQCVGRVVRSNTGKNKTAYVIEFEDKLPNVLYKIDNQWLYADISDYLEPKVLELKVWDDLDLRDKISTYLRQNNIEINKEDTFKIENLTVDKVNSLMFFDAMPEDIRPLYWRLLVLDNENREKYIRLFNSISNNMDRFIEINNADHILFNILNFEKEDRVLSNKNFRESFIFSLQKAYEQKKKKREVTRLSYFVISKKPSNWLIKSLRFFLKIFINIRKKIHD